MIDVVESTEAITGAFANPQREALPITQQMLRGIHGIRQSLAATGYAPL